MRPHHHSMRGKRRLPSGFTSIAFSHDQSEMLEKQAISVFEDMTKNGFTFIEAIAAVYLTGLHDATVCRKDTQ